MIIIIKEIINMQSQLVDKKLAILYERYRDFDFAANAQKEVE